MSINTISTTSFTKVSSYHSLSYVMFTKYNWPKETDYSVELGLITISLLIGLISVYYYKIIRSKKRADRTVQKASAQKGQKIKVTTKNEHTFRDKINETTPKKELNKSNILIKGFNQEEEQKQKIYELKYLSSPNRYGSFSTIDIHDQPGTYTFFELRQLTEKDAQFYPFDNSKQILKGLRSFSHVYSNACITTGANLTEAKSIETIKPGILKLKYQEWTIVSEEDKCIIRLIP